MASGARDGMKIRVPGRGSSGKKGGPSGDLFVVTRVEEHPVFERRGDDFLVDVPVNFVEAALGAEIEVPKPGGLMVRVGVVVPKKLSRREKEILVALAEEQDEDVRGELLRKAEAGS